MSCSSKAKGLLIGKGLSVRRPGRLRRRFGPPNGLSCLPGVDLGPLPVGEGGTANRWVSVTCALGRGQSRRWRKLQEGQEGAYIVVGRRGGQIVVEFNGERKPGIVVDARTVAKVQKGTPNVIIEARRLARKADHDAGQRSPPEGRKGSGRIAPEDEIEGGGGVR